MDFPILGLHTLLTWPYDGPICPSTAYEGCHPPYICWDVMGEPFNVGLGPQTLHKSVICSPALNHNFRRLPTSGTTQVVVMVMGRIWRHMPIHSIWSLSTTFQHMLGGDIGTIPCWVRASATAQWYQLQPSNEPEIQMTSQFLAYTCSWLIMVSYVYPQHMKLVKNRSYVGRRYWNHSMLD